MDNEIKKLELDALETIMLYADGKPGITRDMLRMATRILAECKEPEKAKY